MDGAVLGRAVPEIGLVAAPVVAGHGARRHVHEPAVQAVDRGIRHFVGSEIPGEVPGGDGRLDERGVVVPGQRFDLVATEPPVEQARAVDLAVEESLYGGAARGLDTPDSGHEERHIVLARPRLLRFPLRHRPRLVPGPAFDGELVESDAAHFRIECGGDKVPARSEHRDAGGEHLDFASSIPQPQAETAVLIDQQAVTRAAGCGPLRYDPLDALPGGGRVNPGL